MVQSRLSSVGGTAADGSSATHRSVTCCGNIFIGGQVSARRYVFITWKGDHLPRHVHVYRDGTLIVKWDLENQKAMKGAATRRILELIRELEAEGLL